MLETLRKGAGTWVAKIFIGILVLSFAVWGIADIFGGYGQQTVATVGEEIIDQNDYQRAYQDQLRAMSNVFKRQLTAEQARALGIESSVLSRLIASAALNAKANELNLGVTDQAILSNITRDPSFSNQNGQFSRVLFNQLLYSNGLNENSYVASQRETTVRKQLTDSLIHDLLIPDEYIKITNSFRNESRSIRYFSLPASTVGDIKKPEESALKSYWESNKRTFTAPEFRKLSLLVLDPDELKETIEIPEEMVKETYNIRKDDFTVPERREIQQIPFKNLQEAQEAYKKLKAGKSFEELAKEKSLTDEDIKLGIVAKEDLLDSKISEVAFSLKKDAFSEPVEGTLSTVILRVTNILDRVERSYNDVKKEIKIKLAKTKAEEVALDLHDKIEDERAAGATLKEIASNLNLKYIDIEGVDKDGYAADGKRPEKLPTSLGLLSSAYKSDEGVENDPVETGTGGYIWFDVVEVIPEKLKPFDESKAEVEKKWHEAEVRKALRQKAGEIVKALQGGESFKKVAGEYKAKIEPIKKITRTSNFTGLPDSLAQQVYALPEGGFGSVGQKDGSARIIFEVEKVQPAGELAEKDKKALEDQLKRQITNDLLAQYVTALQNQYGVSINQNTLDILTGRSGVPGSRGPGS